jgi:hypothetical protein
MSCVVLTAILQMCTDSDVAAEVLKHPPETSIQFWAFNITNPIEFANGQTAKIHELGPYGLSLKPKTHSVDFSESAGTISFEKYNDFDFDSSIACSDCESDDTIRVTNFAYSKLIGGAQNEGLLLLASTCSTSQIGLISNATFPYCKTAEMGTAKKCRCCAPAGAINATTCSTIASPTSKAGGIQSWLAKYDNGLKLSTTASAFALSDGAYSGLIREMSVTELVFGAPSAQVGMMSTAQAVTTSVPAIYYANSNTTKDLIDACYALNCPTIQSIAANVGTSGVSALRSVECTGRVANWKVLMNDGGLSEERALELRYMEGVSCRPLGVTLAISAILTVDTNSVKSCVDGSNAVPCCLKSFYSPQFGMKGSGMGCHQWINGIIQTRRLYSMEEARKYIVASPQQKAYSGCASGSDKLKQIMWQGVTSYKDWFTPSSYTYPKMPWADPTVVNAALKGVASGVMTRLNVTGYLPALREGRGINSKFLDYQLTDGDPKFDEEEIWSGYRLNTIKVVYKKAGKVDGIAVNKFIPDTSRGVTDAEIEAEQRKGQLPFGNMENLVYATDGGPIVMAMPHFYSSDPSMLTQSSNIKLGTPSTVGVELYRTRDGYSRKSKLLDAPELVTVDTWDKYGYSDYQGYLHIEPASGVALSGSQVNQLNTFTWNCNPQLDSTCSFKATAYDASKPMCYIAGGKMMPCSAANVFTPRVMGSKVMPLYWLRSKPEAPEWVGEALKSGIDRRYAVSILVIIIPCLAGIGLFVCLFLILKTMQVSHEPVAKDDSK